MADDLYVQIGLRIREAREARDLTQSELATAADLSRVAVTNVERGRHALSLRKLLAVALALDIPLISLIDGPVPKVSNSAEANREAVMHLLNSANLYLKQALLMLAD